MKNVMDDASAEKLKDSSLETFGYICQNVGAAIGESKSNQILKAIVNGMRQQEPSVRLSAIEAMINALELTKNSFADTDKRNDIMRVVCEATQEKDTRIRALQCLVRIVSLYYNYMDTYMKKPLFAIIVDAMKSPDNNVSLQGIEFWSNVCVKELVLARQEQEAHKEGRTPIDVSRFYAKKEHKSILPLLLNILAKKEADECFYAAGVCAKLLDKCVPETVPFIQQNLEESECNFAEDYSGNHTEESKAEEELKEDDLICYGNKEFKIDKKVFFSICRKKKMLEKNFGKKNAIRQNYIKQIDERYLFTMNEERKGILVIVISKNAEFKTSFISYDKEDTKHLTVPTFTKHSPAPDFSTCINGILNKESIVFKNGNELKIEELPKNSGISGILTINQEILLPQLIQNIVVCDLNALILKSQKMFFYQFKFLTSSGSFKELEFHSTIVCYSNREIVPYEIILDSIPSLCSLQL
uniref:Uncharacterized protein n=1 Tax=Panagrolaimus davidi TaxID=227884 RepID=A0A914QG88_9BILA